MRHAALAVVFAVAGCASAGSGQSSDATDASGEADLAPAPDLWAPPPDLTLPPDLSQPPDLVRLKDYGEPCAADGECASALCKPLGPDRQKICVASCRAQADCARYAGTFCEPRSADAPDGYCIGLSPFHCATCEKDDECGGLSERCLQAPGDIAPACHIDCSLGGADACPADYTCSDVTDGAKTRKLCLPKLRVCLDALGGYCDRVTLPQPCIRNNDAGTCVGQRVCMLSKRYDRCGAMAPQYKMSCTDMDPAGCMLKYAPGAATTKQNCGVCGRSCAANEDCCGGACKAIDTIQNCGACGRACGGADGCCGGACTALNTVQNCGACGNACPGVGQPTSDVACVDPAARKCDMTCRGENFDVDGSMANGCEKLDSVPPGHEQPSAAYRGSKDCYDGASSDDFSAQVLSDGRAHQNPAIASFSGAVGAAPDWWRVFADGGTFCQDDYSVEFSTGGGGGTPCYTCTIITNKKTQSVTVSGSGSASMSSGLGSYSDDTDIYFKIEKTCTLPVQEAVTYTVRYHL